MSICECNGNGVIVTCCDDICQGRGECMHGDGERTCPCQDDDYGDEGDDGNGIDSGDEA